ncbi:unnamed protein product [Discula destructiva]
MAEHEDHNGGIIAALRSVYFYYISCSPCRKIGHRRETRREAELQAGMKARLEMEQPGLYRHPNPENTNQYWLEDINMGPSLSKNKVKRGPSQTTSQRHLQSAGTSEAGPSRRPTAETVNPPSPIPDRPTSVGSSTRFPATETASSPTVVADELEARTTLSMSVTDSQDLDWNRERYDREDEELWGSHVYNKAGQRIRDVITKGKDTAGRLFDASRTPRDRDRDREITEEERVNFYTAPRNPPVNDYHPPVVSARPASKHEYRWMLQPPPSAKVMEGKVPVNRSGSLSSATSRRTNRTIAASLASKEELGLSRLVSEKIVQDKIRNGQRPNGPNGTDLSVNSARPQSRRTRTNSTMGSIPGSHRSTRSRSNTTGSESSDNVFDRRMKRREERRKAAEAAAGSEADDDTECEGRGGTGAAHATERRAIRRPHLQTIASSNLSSPKSESSDATMRLSARTAMSPESTSRSLTPVNCKGSPLEDVTNRSPGISPTSVMPAQSADKERSAGASLDSGLALA